jgi:predicted RNA-binding protein with PIN domain
LWKNPPLVLVDGYNVINQWSRLKKHFVKGDLERSRQLLCDDLESLAVLKGWRIEVVFDAARASMNGGGSGPASNVLGANPKAFRSTLQQRLSPTKQVLKHGRVRTVFTGSGIEADSYIEGRCLEAKNVLKSDGKLTQSLIVATDDNMIRICASSAGATLMSASRFVTELKACQHTTQYNVELAMSKVNNMPMRPEKLWNTNVFVQSNFRNTNMNNQDGKDSNDSIVDDDILGKVQKVETKNDGSTVYVPRFGSGSIIIEDRRNRNKHKRQKNSIVPNENSPPPTRTTPTTDAAGHDNTPMNHNNDVDVDDSHRPTRSQHHHHHQQQQQHEYLGNSMNSVTTRNDVHESTAGPKSPSMFDILGDYKHS